MIEMKTRGYSIGARGIASLIDRPDIWSNCAHRPLQSKRKDACKSGGVHIWAEERSPSIANDGLRLARHILPRPLRPARHEWSPREIGAQMAGTRPGSSCPMWDRRIARQRENDASIAAKAGFGCPVTNHSPYDNQVRSPRGRAFTGREPYPAPHARRGDERRSE